MFVRLTVAAAALLVTAACSQHTGTPIGRTVEAPSPHTLTPSAALDLHAAVRRWWQRSVAMPRSQYFTPKGCGLKQPADIWLLGGGPAGDETHRRCDVPANRLILAPVITGLADTDLPSPSEPMPDSGPMDVRLDGRSLTPVKIENRPYRLHGAPGSVVRGDVRVTDDGYWVLLPGLAPGVHTLTIRIPGLHERPYLAWTLNAT
ncbi:hypothetical protein GCM10023196_028810 [Actinoallomurus vinaceus]|uniref:Lipoprotein n=1 Tax=Actinoallomurus vinaceus TaxID=1080074 RepID=A0ABP8U753_9ACTN